jgi:citrate lyase subunit beta/citryl-CoA lyase
MKPLRSFLFIPGDSEKKLGKADGCGADAVILDLEDAVAPANKPMARQMVANFLKARPKEGRTTQLWVRVNPFDTGMTDEDVAAIVPGAPDGIMQPKTDGPDCVRRLSDMLDKLEAESGVDAGSIRILPVATETPIAPFRLGDFATAGLDRLAGLTLGCGRPVLGYGREHQPGAGRTVGLHLPDGPVADAYGGARERGSGDRDALRRFPR